MIFHVGEVPKTKDFSDEGLTLLREPVEEVFERIVGVLFVFFLLSMFGLWAILGAVDWPASPIMIVFQVLLTAVLLIPIHEAVHGLLYPRSKTGKVVFGFWPQKMYFYAAYTGVLSRNRSVLVYVAPFLLLSVLPLVYAFFEGSISPWLALASIINAGFSSADLYVVFLLVSQVPGNGSLQNNGWFTYWRSP